MIRSMTGFGTGTAVKNGWRAEATIRTLNHRYLSVRIRAIGDRPGLQNKVEEHVRRAFSRGEIGVWLTLERDTASGEQTLFDHEAARSVYRELQHLAETLDLPDPPGLDALLRAGALQPPDEADESLWPAVRSAVDDAVGAVTESRRTEGEVLESELLRLVDLLRGALADVENRLPEVVREIRDRLLDRVGDLEISVEPERLEAEVALLADRYDVQEEIVRLRGHLERAAGLLGTAAAVGKELDFLSQEMLREVNTIGSKVRDLETSHRVIDMKVAIEQFKEQIQNVE